MTDPSSSVTQMNGNKQDTRRSSFGRTFLSNLGNSLRGIHQEDSMLSNSPTIGNLAKFTDDHESRSNGLQDISNSDDDEDDVNLYEDAQFVRNNSVVIPGTMNEENITNITNTESTVNNDTTNTIREVNEIVVSVPIKRKENQSSSELSRKDTIVGNVPQTSESDLLPIVDTNDDNVISQPTSSSTSQDSPDSESQTNIEDPQVTAVDNDVAENTTGIDKDGFFSIRLTPLIDHSSSTSGLYFLPIIRKIKPSNNVAIGRYTEKNKAAAHAPQGSSAPIVFKSKVVSRTHALFQCNDIGQWFLKDCKSSSGTFLNHIRLSPASQESTLMPLIDGDIIQLGMDYRGGTEEVYRCVKMRCEFNKSWQRKVNQFNLEIHKKIKNLQINDDDAPKPLLLEELSECAICLMKVDPCQALFMSPCSHAWHYKCIRPIIIKSYPQFYCPNCRTMCDLETDIEDD